MRNSLAGGWVNFFDVRRLYFFSYKGRFSHFPISYNMENLEENEPCKKKNKVEKKKPIGYNPRQEARASGEVQKGQQSAPALRHVHVFC